MGLDWLNPGICTYVHVHLGHPAPFGLGHPNIIFRARVLTLRGAR